MLPWLPHRAVVRGTREVTRGMRYVESTEQQRKPKAPERYEVLLGDS